MYLPGKARERALERRQQGFSLLELIVVLGILVSVSAIIMSGMFQMTMAQGTISNRSGMHSSVRSATELLQQEIGQAGRVASPTALTAPIALTGTGSPCAGLTGNYVVCGAGTSATLGVTSSAGLFPGEVVIIGPDSVASPCPPVAPATTCASQENLTLTAVGTNTISGVFQDPHASGAPVSVRGTFASGVVPLSGSKILSWSTSVTPNASVVTTLSATQASTANLLKLYGDVNGDGNMVYIEYGCNQGTTNAPGTLTRRVVPYNTASAKSTFPAQVLLSNILANPGGTPCFAYQSTVVRNDTYVIDVAVTLTVQTQNKDPQTGLYQTETKALLNVSPRNVFEGWQMASLPGGIQTRIQPMPQSVVTLLP
jgi:prepilin-type N-terminal cleavage/methylation domain-containing protein